MLHVMLYFHYVMLKQLQFRFLFLSKKSRFARCGQLKNGKEGTWKEEEELKQKKLKTIPQSVISTKKQTLTEKIETTNFENENNIEKGWETLKRTN